MSKNISGLQQFSHEQLEEKIIEGILSFRIVKICFRNWLDFGEIIETSNGVALKYVISLIEHYYYLYKKDGKMSMIPWDYGFNEGNGVN